ncbi:hypothetical protein M768_00825 [Cellulosimicrobium cellulans F16]|uniref:Uncharacterized protein n=1 Tax=Cellulosimicrobium cellulans F16 TaxID=1350482 RepID=A0A0M0FBF5_CELCE|nr:hypothetical protein M768_00825 [Cellulosimicrobium cellulans F16]
MNTMSATRTRAATQRPTQVAPVRVRGVLVGFPEVRETGSGRVTRAVAAGSPLVAELSGVVAMVAS